MKQQSRKEPCYFEAEVESLRGWAIVGCGTVYFPDGGGRRFDVEAWRSFGFGGRACREFRASHSRQVWERPLARARTRTLSFKVSSQSLVKPLLSMAWLNMYSMTGL